MGFFGHRILSFKDLMLRNASPDDDDDIIMLL